MDYSGNDETRQRPPYWDPRNQRPNYVGSFDDHRSAATAGPYNAALPPEYPPGFETTDGIFPPQAAVLPPAHAQYLDPAIAHAATSSQPPSLPPPHQQRHLNYAAAVAAGLTAAPYQPPPPLLPPRDARPATGRPIAKLTVSLINTYKQINRVYYQDRETRKNSETATTTTAEGTTNNGWDDEHYDYILTEGEMFYGRYKLKERIGKGSFGQVVRAEDMQTNRDVAIKIIKSKRPFLMQAKTEIELLRLLADKDPDDKNNIVRLLTHFMYRNHQCLVFEMLSLNLYELLKNTYFSGVSLNLVRKFGKQVLRSLAFLRRRDVDVIHCDLKPENILLRHPKKSAIKVIDFGSSCRSNKRMYSYIQSRFYRSPEVILGLTYSTSIDMWSLGCILAEMHTGEPLFSGADDFDQIKKIVTCLGMVPAEMLDRSNVKQRFFLKTDGIWKLRREKEGGANANEVQTIEDIDPIVTLSKSVVAGRLQKKKFPQSEAYNSAENHRLFIDLISKMLVYSPEQRLDPLDALRHPFLQMQED